MSNFISKFKKRTIDRFFMFGNLYQPIIPFKVNIIYWRKSKSMENVGDLLSKIIVEAMVTRFNLKEPKSITSPRISGVGSIIQSLTFKTTVWGSGIITEGSIGNLLKRKLVLDIRSVRGPETRRVLLSNGYKCPELYGDPAILLPLIYQPQGLVKKLDYVVVPHHLKQDNYKNESNVVSTITSDWKGFINKILEAEYVISASLHGIIIAEAYGVPAILLNDLQFDLFKFNDYYFSTGREKYKIAENIEHAKALGPEILPDFKEIQNDLIDAFPKDLWNH